MSGPNLWGSGRIWSLWEMLQLTADRFSRALQNFAQMRALLFEFSTNFPSESVLSGESAAGVLDILKALEAELRPIEANFTARAVCELRELIEGGEYRAPILSERARELESRLHHEFESVTMLVIDKAHADLYQRADSFLDEAAQKAFPPATFDCEEAARCLALGRPTAAVFHMMRGAESAAAIVSAKLGGDIHNQDGEPLTFGGLFKEVSDKIDAMPRGEKKDAWLHVKGLMASLNRGTRTKVAHPGTWYTEKKAETVFAQTKSFMQEAEELLRP